MGKDRWRGYREKGQKNLTKRSIYCNNKRQKEKITLMREKVRFHTACYGDEGIEKTIS